MGFSWCVNSMLWRASFSDGTKPLKHKQCDPSARAEQWLVKAVGSSERTKALKGKAQECRQVKQTARDALAKHVGWVKKPRARYFPNVRQRLGRPFEKNGCKKGLMCLGMLKGTGA